MTATFLTQVEGFTPIIDVVAEDVGLVGAAIYGVVWRYCQMKDGVCYASREILGQKAGVSLATVNRYLDVLCQRGYLEDLTPDLRNKPHTYRDAGKVMILGAVAAKRAEDVAADKGTEPLCQADIPAMSESNTALCQADIPAMSQCYSRYVTVTYEDTIRDNEDTSPRDNKESLHREKTKSPSPADFGAVQRAWEQSAGLVSKTNYDLLGDLCDEYGAPMVLDALVETVKQIGRPNMKYLEAVLQNWKDRGTDKRHASAKAASQQLQKIGPGVWRA